MITKRKNPEGYKELLVYRRTEELQDYVYKITEDFPIKESRRRVQMRDSARSTKQNIVEGWKRETTEEYLDFLSYSFGSLGELKEDGEDCFRYKIINEPTFAELRRRCGEVDYLMRRLKESLEKKVAKSGNLTINQKWQAIKQEEEKQKDFYKEMLEKRGLVMTARGVMKKEEAEKRGLEELEV